jgi:hypothetical protein
LWICRDKLKNQALWKRLPKITIFYFKRLHRIISMVIFSIDNKVRLTTKHYSKPDYFNLPIVNFIQLHLQNIGQIFKWSNRQIDSIFVCQCASIENNINK